MIAYLSYTDQIMLVQSVRVKADMWSYWTFPQNWKFDTTNATHPAYEAQSSSLLNCTVQFLGGKEGNSVDRLSSSSTLPTCCGTMNGPFHLVRNLDRRVGFNASTLPTDANSFSSSDIWPSELIWQYWIPCLVCPLSTVLLSRQKLPHNIQQRIQICYPCALCSLMYVNWKKGSQLAVATTPQTFISGTRHAFQDKGKKPPQSAPLSGLTPMLQLALWQMHELPSTEQDS